MPIKASINVLKITKEKLFVGKSGKYLNFVIYENEQPDQYGNTFVIKEDLSQEERQSGVKAKIIGNGKSFGGQKPVAKPAPPARKPAPAPDPDLDADSDEIDEIPF